jgi:putative ABC transport system permease protein
MPKYFGVDDDTGEPLPPEKVLGYRYHKYFKIAQGKVFAPMKFEAIIGSDVAAQTGLAIGSTFQATHGLLPPKPGEQPDIHPEVWTVVGILEKTHTANDRVLFIPIKTFYTIGEHSRGLKAHFYILHHLKMPEMDDEDHIPVYTLNPDKTINLLVPPEYWEVSSVLVETRSAIGNQDLQYTLNNDVNVMAVNPAGVMKQFFDTFLSTSTDLLLVISSLVTVVAAVSILVSIYNSVSARKKEIAILRALGATKQRVMTLICVEAGIIGLVGGLLGLLGGHILAAVGNIYFEQVLGETINWLNVGWGEWVYLVAVVVLALLAGLVPALKAYSTPVATNLVSS